VERVNRQADPTLAARLMVRDEGALRDVMDLYGGIVHGMARKIVGEPALAEEVAQETFLTLWRRPGAFDPERGSLKTFLASIARNKAIDLVRHEESLRRTREALDKEMQVTNDRIEPDGIDDRHDIVVALGQLTDLQREALALAYFGGRSYREVARELGIPEGTAKTRLRDGLQRLRSVLKDAKEEARDE
jgi:RNA polymerase sigma-70 factor (ECF subfamily)